MKKIVIFTIVGLLVFAVIFEMKKGFETFGVIGLSTHDSSNEESKKTIVIDPGHGGVDPGKVGVNGALEKDVNLSISLKLKQLFEKEGFTVIMTRESDKGLYSDSDSNKKRADLKKRVEVINNSSAVLAISIHQNSFQEESSTGAQVFYHTSSDKGREIAEMVQEQIKSVINDGNHRVAKSNDSYYMLKKTQCPLIIIECGFLSNNKEADLLIDNSYQDKMAEAIEEGIIKYLNKNT